MDAASTAACRATLTRPASMGSLGVWKGGLPLVVGVIVPFLVRGGVSALLCLGVVVIFINLHGLSPCSVFVGPDSLILRDTENGIDEMREIRGKGGRTSTSILGRHFLPRPPSPSEHGTLLELEIPIPLGHRFPNSNGRNLGQTLCQNGRRALMRGWLR